MTEFKTLSEKRKWGITRIKTNMNVFDEELYLKEDIKEFIKVINNKMKHLGYREDVEMARAIINEIAGDKLCWNYNIQT